jgi:hypothetical protein
MTTPVLKKICHRDHGEERAVDQILSHSKPNTSVKPAKEVKIEEF